MLALETWMLFSFGAYYKIYTKTSIQLSISMPVIYIPAILLLAFNYYTLDYKVKWRKYNDEFANYSEKKNRIGGWIVFGIILLIIGNFRAAGSLRGKPGVWELGINPKTRVIYHFLFKPIK